MNPEDYKKAVKEALREWLDEKYALLGKWAVRSFIASLLALIAYLILVKSGWTPPGVQ